MALFFFFYIVVVASENGQLQQQKHIIRINQDGQVVSQSQQRVMMVVQNDMDSTPSSLPDHPSPPPVKITYPSVRVSNCYLST